MKEFERCLSLIITSQRRTLLFLISLGASYDTRPSCGSLSLHRLRYQVSGLLAFPVIIFVRSSLIFNIWVWAFLLLFSDGRLSFSLSFFPSLAQGFFFHGEDVYIEGRNLFVSLHGLLFSFFSQLCILLPQPSFSRPSAFTLLASQHFECLSSSFPQARVVLHKENGQS